MSRISVETCWRLEENDSDKTPDGNMGYKRVSVAFENVTCVGVVIQRAKRTKGKVLKYSGSDDREKTSPKWGGASRFALSSGLQCLRPCRGR
jgi:hypothetical protein